MWSKAFLSTKDRSSKSVTVMMNTELTTEPLRAINIATKRPGAVAGAISPYPTVVMVITVE